MLYRFFQSNPIVRLVLPLVMGIVISNHFTITPSLVLLGLFLLLFVLFFVASRPILFVSIHANLTTVFFLLLGVFMVQNHKGSYALPKSLDTHYVKAIVRAEADEKVKSMAVPILVTQFQKGREVYPSHFKSIAYFPKDSILLKWNYGDTIIAKLQFLPLNESGNPYAFNYAKLLQQRQVYCTARGRIAEVVWKRATQFSVFRYARLTQKKLSSLLNYYIPDKKAKGFLQAMTLGDRSSLSPDVQIDFADTGVVHILAVSGLHVGILFLLINLLLRPLRATQRGKLVLVVISLSIIWSFAFISGLSVSILRAATMFTFLQLSMLSLRPYRVYNTVAASAFVLLLFNPFYLYEVGFQLSYLAVLSIVTFVPIWDKWNVRNIYIDKVKKLFLVSLAAQLGVAPLVLYYFHHLPTYFLLGNLVVLVLAPFLLAGSLLVLAASGVSFLAKILGVLVSWITKACLFLVNIIAQLPGATLADYSLDFYQMLLLYACLLGGIMYSLKRSKSSFLMLLLFIFMFVACSGLRAHKERQQEIFVVHQIRRKTCYSLLKGREALILYDKNLEEEDLSYTVSPFLEARGVENTQTYLFETAKMSFKKLHYRSGHIYLQGKHIVLCPTNLSQFDVPIAVDLLILSHKSDWRLGIKNYRPKLVVIDSSFTKWQSQKLMKELSALSISIHDVISDGAYVLN